MTRRIARWATGIVLAAGLVGPTSQVSAQSGGGSNGNLDGFTVEGKGVIGIKPNRLEIDVEVSAASEMSSDVIVKYRDAKKRLQDAFTNLKMTNITVEEKALNVDQKSQAFNPYMMDTPPAKRGKIELQLTRKLVVRCDKIRDLDEEALLQLVAKLLDVAQDAGAKVGNATNMMMVYYYGTPMGDDGLIRFILDDFEAAEEKAYQLAVVDARSHATRLAQLNGLDLGPVLGVRELAIPGVNSQSPDQSPYYYRRGGKSDTDEKMPKKQITAAKFHEIPVRVELQVRYAAGPASKTPARQGGQ